MKSYFIIPVIVIWITSCYSPRSAEQKLARKLQSHTVSEDTSHIYQLPYESGTTHRMIQGYFSRYTHKYKAAVDFKMKKNTPILAARDGHVVRVKDDSDRGGFNKKYRPDANFIVIAHADSTRASYRHLSYKGVAVKIGEFVRAGQLIGYSGNTGYTISPHLHFMITTYKDNQWVTIPCRFKSNGGTGYVKPMHLYTSVNKLAPDQPSPKSEVMIAN